MVVVYITHPVGTGRIDHVMFRLERFSTYIFFVSRPAGLVNATLYRYPTVLVRSIANLSLS